MPNVGNFQVTNNIRPIPEGEIGLMGEVPYDPPGKKLPPSSEKLEEALIAGCIFFPDKVGKVFTIISADDLVIKRNKEALQAIYDLYQEGKEINLASIGMKVKHDAARLASLTSGPSFGSPEQHAKDLKKEAVTRKAITALSQAQKALCRGDAPEKVIESITEIIQQSSPETPSGLLDLERYEVGQEYVDALGKETFLIPNLIIKQHVVTIIAKSGSGKTTFFFFVVAPQLASQGLIVWYIDADSPASDHKRMKELANKHGFKFINPDTTQGGSMTSLIESLRGIADRHENLSDQVLIFDTLKKAADLMSKRSVKEFYQLVRKLANLGATIILLGHANKYADKDGNMVFEGTGDVKSDSDELIFFESKKNDNGGLDVTTCVDTDKGAKVRGLFSPFSFHIGQDRQVTYYDQVIEIGRSNTQAPAKTTDEDIIEVAKTYLKMLKTPIKQQQLVQYVSDVTGTGLNKVRQTITIHVPMKNGNQPEGELVFSVGKNNARLYEIATKTEQTSIEDLVLRD